MKDELTAGQYRDISQFVETAVQYFLDQLESGARRLDVLHRIGKAADDAGLYERALAPSRE